MAWTDDVERRLEGDATRHLVFRALISRKDMTASFDEILSYTDELMEKEPELAPVLHTLQANRLVRLEGDSLYGLTPRGEKYLEETMEDFEEARKQLEAYRDIME